MKKFFLGFLAIFFVFGAYELSRAVLLPSSNISIRPYTTVGSVSAANSSSRAAMVLAERIVQLERTLSPAEAARWYAYVATVYAETLEKTDDEKEAFLTANMFVRTVYPKYAQLTDAALSDVKISTKVLSQGASDILETYVKRYAADGHELVWNQKVPTSENGWYRRTGLPQSPTAAHWKRWRLQPETVIMVGAPESSDVREKYEIAQVSSAVGGRTDKRVEEIFLWYGGPSWRSPFSNYVSPAGIWQNVFSIESGEAIDSVQYARGQKILAQSIADSAILCSQAKYLYWTARPSMVIPNIPLVSADPESPSYPSDFSCMSATAEVILEYLVPEKTSVWQEVRKNAQAAQLASGNEWERDVLGGYELGRAIGKEIVGQLKGKTNDPKQILVPTPKEYSIVLLARTAVFNGVAVMRKKLAFMAPGKNLKREEETLRANIERAPMDAAGYITLADFYRAYDKGKESEVVLNKAVELDPTNDYPYILLGNYYRQSKETYAQAERMLKQAILLNPYNDWPWIQLGKLYVSQKRFPEAQQALVRALTLHTIHYGESGAHVLLLALYDGQKRWADQQSLLERMLEKDPDVSLYIEYAKLLERLGYKERAYEIYAKATKAFPQSQQLREALPADFQSTLESLKATVNQSQEIVK